jgi:hypothetical protein
MQQRAQWNQRIDADCTKQVSVSEQGGGPGRSGPGPLWDIEACRDRVWVAAGAKEAAARPAIATSRANTRMAEFIFGNLIELELGGRPSLSMQKTYRNSLSKSSFFIMLQRNNV